MLASKDELGKRIHDLRYDKGWNQVELAERVGRHVGAVSAWETGRSYPNHLACKKLEELFELEKGTLRIAKQPRHRPRDGNTEAIKQILDEAEAKLSKLFDGLPVELVIKIDFPQIKLNLNRAA